MVSELEIDTEQKIKNAAKEIFQSKGFSGTKTRDIADLAGINVALLNYYFRSKKKLFEMIMIESFQEFFGGVLGILNNEETSIEEKLQLFVDYYIDLLISNPNIPHFIINNVRENPEGFIKQFMALSEIRNSFFFKQFEAIPIKSLGIEPLHFLLNLLGLVIFPFLAKPMVLEVSGTDDINYQSILRERKKLIPIWMKTILNVEYK